MNKAASSAENDNKKTDKYVSSIAVNNRTNKLLQQLQRSPNLSMSSRNETFENVDEKQKINTSNNNKTYQNIYTNNKYPSESFAVVPCIQITRTNSQLLKTNNNKTFIQNEQVKDNLSESNYINTIKIKFI